MKKLSIIAASLVIAACATPGETSPVSERKGILADARGMTLYTFKKDLPNVSNCYDNCAKTWPPFLASASAKPTAELTLVSRKDGSNQWAYRGQPLYRYVGDTEAGQQNGEGSGGTWYSAKKASGGSAY